MVVGVISMAGFASVACTDAVAATVRSASHRPDGRQWSVCTESERRVAVFAVVAATAEPVEVALFAAVALMADYVQRASNATRVRTDGFEAIARSARVARMVLCGLGAHNATHANMAEPGRIVEFARVVHMARRGASAKSASLARTDCGKCIASTAMVAAMGCSGHSVDIAVVAHTSECGVFAASATLARTASGSRHVLFAARAHMDALPTPAASVMAALTGA